MSSYKILSWPNMIMHTVGSTDIQSTTCSARGKQYCWQDGSSRQKINLLCKISKSSYILLFDYGLWALPSNPVSQYLMFATSPGWHFKQRRSVSKFHKVLAHMGMGTGMKGELTSATFASAMRGHFEGPGPPWRVGLGMTSWMEGTEEHQDSCWEDTKSKTAIIHN